MYNKRRAQMSQSIVPSRGFSDEILAKVVIGKLYYKRPSWIEKLCCERCCNNH